VGGAGSERARSATAEIVVHDQPDRRTAGPQAGRLPGRELINARDEQHYREGHIPGACEFDPYHPEKYFATVLPVCQAAEQIVLYCNGGDCDDSESAAITLRDVGIANQKLFVYTGGITEWTTNGLPVEIGGRNSGNLRSTNK